MGLFDKFVQLLGDPETMPGKKKKSPSTLPTDHTLHKEDYSVVGMIYHKKELQRLATALPDYKASAKKNVADGLVMTRIWRYDYVNKPVDLVPEPTNAHDRNAVMVKIAGEHVGYISQEDNVHVGEILEFGSIKYITARITGGDYKVVSENGDTVKDTDYIRINVRIAYSV